MGFQGLHRSNYTSDIMLTLSLNPRSTDSGGASHLWQSAVRSRTLILRRRSWRVTEPAAGLRPMGTGTSPTDCWEQRRTAAKCVRSSPVPKEGKSDFVFRTSAPQRATRGCTRDEHVPLVMCFMLKTLRWKLPCLMYVKRLQHTVRHICKHVLTTSNICKMHQKMQIWHHLCLPPIRIDNKATHKQNRSLKTQPSHENRKHPIEEKIQRTENKWQKKTTIFRDSWSPSPPQDSWIFRLSVFLFQYLFCVCIFFLVHVVSFS